MPITYNPPGEYKCGICNKFYPEDDIRFVGKDPVCYECYEREANKSSGLCGVCGSPLKNSEKTQCYRCRQDAYRDRENNLQLGDDSDDL